MYTVIDTIDLKAALLQRYPAMGETEGLLAVLDPEQVREPFNKPDKVRVSRPDGTLSSFDVSGVRVNADGVIALFFSNANAAEIPRGSEIEPA